MWPEFLPALRGEKIIVLIYLVFYVVAEYICFCQTMQQKTFVSGAVKDSFRTLIFIWCQLEDSI